MDNNKVFMPKWYNIHILRGMHIFVADIFHGDFIGPRIILKLTSTFYFNAQMSSAQCSNE